MQFDWNALLHIEWNLTFLLSFLNIMFINLILSGDNAVLIAMAVRNLPKNQRTKGIVLGSVGAILLRVVLTYFVALLLEISFIKLVGGVMILWIAVKLFTEADGGGNDENQAMTMAHAVKIILIADITMSLDNVLAVAGAAGDSLFLLISGLVMSIPIVIFTSNLLSTLMDKYPVIIVIGGAILGKVGGGMIMTDLFIANRLSPLQMTVYAVEAVCMVGVVVVGKLWMKWKIAKAEREFETDELAHEAESEPVREQKHPRP